MPGRREVEHRLTHEYRGVWWELDLPPSEPEQWYWKLLRNEEPVNGGIAATSFDCRVRVTEAYLSVRRDIRLSRQDYYMEDE